MIGFFYPGVSTGNTSLKEIKLGINNAFEQKSNVLADLQPDKIMLFPLPAPSHSYTT